MSSVGMAGAVAIVVAGAVIYPGFTSADVDLNDGSVWVTNRSMNMVAHLNAESGVLDGGFAASTESFDVIQNAGTVFMENDGGTLLNRVDVPSMSLTEDTSMSGGKQVSQGTSVVAVADPAVGNVWVLNPDSVTSFSDKTTKPSLTGVLNARVAVAQSNTDDPSTVFVLNPKAGELVTLQFATDGKLLGQSSTKVEGLPDSNELVLTAVGEKAVVLDRGTGTLYLPESKPLKLDDGKDSQLQQVSAESDFVAVETTRGLIAQPLNGDAATFAAASAPGQAIAPVQQTGCVHAAWGGANEYMLYCDGQDPVTQAIPQANAQSRLVFRKNRDIVVLNDTAGGNVWLVNDNLKLVNNWDDLKADQSRADDPEKDSVDPNVVNTLPDRSKANRPPEAKNDSYGVRAGSTAILPVLYNDSDPDGDVLTVRGGDGKLSVGTIEPIYGGTGLQLIVPAGAPETTESFPYTADDGRGGTAQATVNVRVVPENENSEAVSLRPTNMVVVQGQSMSQNVLNDMSDPDGDDIFLVGAVAGDDSAEVKFTPDGQLTYIDNGQSSGAKSATITVSDNRTTVEKKISVTVKSDGAVPPIANADYVRVISGQSVIVAPLTNDQDPAGGKLRLASVDKVGTATISTIADNGTFTFSSKTTGNVYLNYQVTNGPQSSTGLIRIDVVAPDEAMAPVAVKDIARLPAGGTALVDVLGNDSDPAGGILVVRSVDVPEGSGLSATVLDHKIVKISDVRSNGQPISIKYTISNGHDSANGSVAIVQIPSPSTHQPPAPEPDSATVRVGDVVRIPVLANDTDPNGDLLKNPEITQGPDQSAGKLWVDQNSLRFLASETPGTVTAIYKVTNSSGQSGSAAVTITVIPADDERNLPPAPKVVEGRVIAGATARVLIPLDGIDPNGDSVQLVGIDTPPTLGTAVVGNGFISYTAAGNSSGTDTFSYKVKDRLGAEAVGQVRIGIAPVEKNNQAPKTQDDYITIRPGRKVALDVTLNDADPDGDRLAVLSDGFDGPDEMQPSVTDQGRVLVTSPKAPGLVTMSYTAADPSGATARGNIRMTVTPRAPLQAPIARDDVVSVQEALGKNTVDVPVLQNDEDPDGVAEGLTVSLARPSANATVSANGTVRVRLAASPQMVPYTVVDQDKLEARAVIWVPGTGQQYPVLKKTDVIKLQAGTKATLDLNDYVRVRDGRKPRISQADKIKLIGAPSQKVVTADGAGISYAPTPDFYGPGSITFEVTDGAGPDDPEGLKSTLTVMTEVTPSPVKNLPPIVIGTQLDVAQLESADLDLSRLASDPEGAALSFKLAGTQQAGISASLEGAQLRVDASKEAKIGSSIALEFEVSDGKNDAAKATITLRVLASTKPLAVANEDIVPDAFAGRVETVDVLANDTNPFPDTPLKVVDYKLISGSTGTAVAKQGDRITVQAPENFTGSVVVGYTVEDKTGDKGRWVDGKITVNVKGKPAIPAAPRIQEVKSHQVMLQWTTAVDNGSPLSGYTVLNSAGASQECATNTCLITGLQNAREYTFKVKASNAVGSSEYSKSSAGATPDASPDAPLAPTVKRGDQKLEISWQTPAGEYSPVTSYNVEISPAPAGQNPQKRGLTGNSFTWGGLVNGTEYSFKVQAVNKAPEPSSWSKPSALGKPAGKPFTPAAPVLSVLDTLGSQNQVRINWNETNLNGGELKNYTLTKYLNGAVQGTMTANVPSAVVSLPNGAGNYTFAVSVSTQVDISDISPQSVPRRSVSKPGRVTGLAATVANTNGAGGQLQVNFAALAGAAMGGSTASELTYWAQLTSQDGSSVGGAPQVIVPGGLLAAANGSKNLSVKVYVTSNATTEQGVAVSALAPVPYGTPGTPSISAGSSGEGDTRGYFSWNAPGGNTDSAMVQINDGNGWGPWTSAKSGSGSIDLGGPDVTRTIQIRSQNSAGTVGSTSGETTVRSGPRLRFIIYQIPGKNNSICTVPRTGGLYHWQPPKCNGVVNQEHPGGQWFSSYDGDVEIDRCDTLWNNSGKWYRMSTGRLAGYYIMPKYVEVRQGSPTGLPGC